MKLKYAHMKFDLRESREKVTEEYDNFFVNRTEKFRCPGKDEKAVSLDYNTKLWEITIVYIDEKCIKGEIFIPTKEGKKYEGHRANGSSTGFSNKIDIEFIYNRMRTSDSTSYKYRSTYWNQIRLKDDKNIFKIMKEICEEAVILMRVRKSRR